MATKKKPTKKKSAAPKKSAKASARPKSKIASAPKSKKAAPAKKVASAKKASPAKKTTPAKSAKPAAKASTNATAKPGKSPNKVRVVAAGLGTRGSGQPDETINLDVNGLDARSGGQSGALQGLSDVEGADSESVDELLEEGNSYEAGIIKGVEDAPNADEEEIHIHERPQEVDLDEDEREN
jgi:hypothetical protein